jgi:exodeoxyribonuclease-3
MKIVTYNLNGIRARLPRFVEYLEEQKPDVLCLQEIKCADEAFPIEDVRAAGYDGVWHGQKGFNGVAILTPTGAPPKLRRVGLPGDPDDTHSRYIEAEVDGVVIGSIYLPNGNPVGTEKFAYKLAWMDRLRDHARALLAEERPTVLAGDWNVIPTDSPDDVFSVRAMAHDALMQPKAAPPSAESSISASPTRSAPAIPKARSTLSGIIPPAAGSATPGSASITCC